ISGCNVFNLQGSGLIENLGLWEIFQDPTCNNGAESAMRLPIDVAAGAKLLLSTNAQVNFSAGSGLTVEGQLELQSGTRLRLDGSNPARDINLASGSSLVAVGTIQLEGGCRLLVPGDLDTTVGVVLNVSSAQLVVPGTYT